MGELLERMRGLEERRPPKRKTSCPYRLYYDSSEITSEAGPSSARHRQGWSAGGDGTRPLIRIDKSSPEESGSQFLTAIPEPAPSSEDLTTSIGSSVLQPSSPGLSLSGSIFDLRSEWDPAGGSATLPKTRPLTPRPAASRRMPMLRHSLSVEEFSGDPFMDGEEGRYQRRGTAPNILPASSSRIRSRSSGSFRRKSSKYRRR